MTHSEQLIAGILIRVARRQVTVAQLKAKLADGMAQVAAVGAANVEPALVEALAVLDSAIARIEASKAKSLAQHGN